MVRRPLILLLLFILIGTSQSFAQVQSDAKSEKLAQTFRSLLADGDSRVQITKRDGSKIKAIIRSTSDDSVTVVDQKAGSTQTLPFTDIDSVKKQSNGLSNRTWIAIGGVSAAAVVVIAVILKPAFCDGGAAC